MRSIPTISQGASTFNGRTVLARLLFLSACWQVSHTLIWNNTQLHSTRGRVFKSTEGKKKAPHPVHHVPDDPQPVVLPLDPVHSLLLAQVMTQLTEVAVEKDLPLPVSLDHNLPLLLLLGSHIVQLALLMMTFVDELRLTFRITELTNSVETLLYPHRWKIKEVMLHDTFYGSRSDIKSLRSVWYIHNICTEVVYSINSN